jgi:hypothetical protein
MCCISVIMITGALGGKNRELLLGFRVSGFWFKVEGVECWGLGGSLNPKPEALNSKPVPASH